MIRSNPKQALNATAPLVTVGVPVFNGGRLISTALHSLVIQDYPNINIIISDNASTDDTPLICQRFAAEYPNITYTKTISNIGAGANFDRLLNLANGQYFMWAAYDDYRDSNFVTKCVEALEKDPRAALACGNVKFVDSNQTFLSELEPVSITDSKPQDRFAKTMKAKSYWASVIYGLHRLSVIKRIRFNDEFGRDFIILHTLALFGKFVHVPTTTLYICLEKVASTAMTVSQHYDYTMPNQQPTPSVWSFSMSRAIQLYRQIQAIPIPKALRRTLIVAICRNLVLSPTACREHFGVVLGGILRLVARIRCLQLKIH